MQKATRYLISASLLLCWLLAGCLSPQYPRAQQHLTNLEQQGIVFKPGSPPVALTSSLFPPELYPPLHFIYVRPRKDGSGPPDALFIYIAHTLDQAGYGQSRIEDFAQAVYGLGGADFPPGTMLHYYRCDEVILVYSAWGNPGVDPAVDAALTDMCGPPFVRYPPSP